MPPTSGVQNSYSTTQSIARDESSRHTRAQYAANVQRSSSFGERRRSRTSSESGTIANAGSASSPTIAGNESPRANVPLYR